MTYGKPSPAEYQVRELSRLILAFEDIDFAINGVKAFLETVEDRELREQCRDTKQHLFHSSVISYCKMFIASRGGRGVIRIRDLPTLGLPECRAIHDSIVALRNECVAHNDAEKNLTFVGWDQKQQLHFPQRLRKMYWSMEEAQKVWALMSCVNRDIIANIYRIFAELELHAGRMYKIDANGLQEVTGGMS